MIWIRRHVMRFLKGFMAPIPGEVAATWHRRLTYAYVFFAFNVFGVVLHHVKSNNPEYKRLQPGDKGGSCLCPHAFLRQELISFQHTTWRRCWDSRTRPSCVSRKTASGQNSTRFHTSTRTSRLCSRRRVSVTVNPGEALASPSTTSNNVG